jgi:hypothetical protein
MEVETGSYDLAGQPILLKVGRRIALDAGAYTLTGQSVGLVASDVQAARGKVRLVETVFAALLPGDLAAYNLRPVERRNALCIEELPL